MKKLFTLLFVFAMGASLISCDEDAVLDLPGTIAITVPANAEIENLGTYTTDIAIAAADGLASLTVSLDGTTLENVSYDGATTGTYSFSYTAVADDADANLTFEFEVADSDGDTDSEDFVLSVGEAPDVVVPETITKAGLITSDETWTAADYYVLGGRVIVPDGVTLTIEAGTIIKGSEGQGSLASALIIAQGGKIMAEGTADAPIIFTSVLDDIEIGETLGSNLAKEDNEKWGGIIILGYAPISAKAGDDVSTIEGLPADEDYAAYGGDDATDDSGVLQYVSIRHGGITIGSDNEINGLTLGGVGTGTTIDNVEIFATLDDGIEFFGGTVNVTNALVVWQGDDGVDIDQNYSGTVDNFYVYHGEGVGTDEGLEIDGPENTLTDGKFTLKNGTIKSDGVDGSAADLKSDAQGTIMDVLFTGYAAGDGLLKVEGEYDDACESRVGANGTFGDALDKLLGGDLVITSSTVEGVEVYSKDGDDDEPLCASIPDADQTAAEAEVVSATTEGADTSVFGWTAAVESGMTL